MVYSIEEIKERLKPIAEKYSIDKVALFGSYARGEADEESDIDFHICGGNFMGTFGGGGFSNDLEQIYGKKVDFIQHECLRTRFYNRIKNEEIVVYER
jgi:predicted nucleotidyltransferase